MNKFLIGVLEYKHTIIWQIGFLQNTIFAGIVAFLCENMVEECIKLIPIGKCSITCDNRCRVDAMKVQQKIQGIEDTGLPPLSFLRSKVYLYQIWPYSSESE